MTRLRLGLLVAATVACIAVLECARSGGQPQGFAPRFSVLPQSAKVFAGNDLQFRTTLVGDTLPARISWSVVGPGSIDASGLYRAAPSPANADVVADAGHGVTDAVSVRTVLPPPVDRSHVLVTCYEDGTVNVYDASDQALAGAFSVGAHAAGIAVDARARHAVFAGDEQLFAVDLHTMRWQSSAPIAGIRLSEVAPLAFGYFAATDNLGVPATAGVRIFRINPLGVPIAVSKISAGDTPEGIATTQDGRTFFVTAINSNGVTRFVLDRNGIAHRTGAASTANRPFGVGVDEAHNLLIVADNDTPTLNGARANPGIERFNLTTLQRLGPVIHTGSTTALPLGVAIDPAASRLFVTDEGLADVAVFALPSFERVATLPTGLTPWLPHVDSQSHRLYVPAARANTVTVYDTKTLRVIGHIPQTCAYPTAVTVASAAQS
jgi:DNA-binding beta-propeller fold protein YncE